MTKYTETNIGLLSCCVTKTVKTCNHYCQDWPCCLRKNEWMM